MNPRAALALATGFTAAAGLYSLLRVAQTLFIAEPDPALVVWSEHAGFFWRAWTVTYAGGTAAFVAWIAARRAPERTARLLTRAIVPTALLVAVQAAFVP